MRAFVICCALGAALFSGGCDHAENLSANTQPPFVKPWVVEVDTDTSLSLSGTIHASAESPMAFQVAGRIIQQKADAGQQVSEGQALFALDPRDFKERVQGAQADLAAATAAVRIAQADLARHQTLLKHNAVSKQAAEQSELMLREARARREGAQTQLSQARNALDYTQLKTPAAGILMDVSGEVGQVVAAGQPVATLAHAGEREVEVYFAADTAPPEQGKMIHLGQSFALELHEAAGAVDSQSRTLRARYTIKSISGEPAPTALQLGSVVRAQFSQKQHGQPTFVVPPGAISERGNAPHVWRIQNQQVQAIPVTLVRIEPETARVQGNLETGEMIVAVGTHLLQENMSVRVQGE